MSPQPVGVPGGEEIALSSVGEFSMFDNGQNTQDTNLLYFCVGAKAEGLVALFCFFCKACAKKAGFQVAIVGTTEFPRNRWVYTK